MDKESRSSESPLQSSTLVAGGLITVCLILTQAFMSLPVLDPAAFIALLAFALALPILVGCLFFSQVEEQHMKRTPSAREQVVLHQLKKLLGIITTPTDRSMAALLAAGQSFAFGGIIAALWHASWIIGVVLVISTVVVGAMYASHYVDRRLIQLSQRDPVDANRPVSETTRTDQQS